MIVCRPIHGTGAGRSLVEAVVVEAAEAPLPQPAVPPDPADLALEHEEEQAVCPEALGKAQVVKSAITVRRQPVGRTDCRSGRNRIPAGHKGRSRPLLAERHRQQARAQEHEAGRRQGKKSVGDNVVVVAHQTPTTPDARPNLLKLYKFPVEITDRNL